MSIYRLVTPLNISRRVDEAFIITSLNGQSVVEYVKSKHLYFSNEQLRNRFYKSVALIRVSMSDEFAKARKTEESSRTLP